MHAERSPERHALRQDVLAGGARLAAFQHQVWYEESGRPGVSDSVDQRTGRVDVGEIPLPEGAEIYLCGPIPFMRAVRAGLRERGVAEDQMHYEVFGSDHWLGQAG